MSGQIDKYHHHRATRPVGKIFCTHSAVQDLRLQRITGCALSVHHFSRAVPRTALDEKPNVDQFTNVLNMLFVLALAAYSSAYYLNAVGKDWYPTARIRLDGV